MTDHTYECCAGKSCTGSTGIGRRDFIKTAVLAAGGLSLLGPGASSAWAEEARLADELAAWTKDLWARGARRVYRGAQLEQIAMPMGGIGAGQVYVTGRGTLDQWQIVNNFNSKAHVPGAHFGIWAKPADGAACARLLQQGDAGDAPGVTAVEFSGEYPIAWVRYLDGSLPVDVSLETFSPFIPLNTKDSGLPAVMFRFSVRNRSDRHVDAAVMMTAPNIVGWDGYTALDGSRHSEYAGNVNRRRDDAHAAVMHLETHEGGGHRLSSSCTLATGEFDVGYHLRLCENVTLALGAPIKTPKASEKTVLWLGDLSQAYTEKELNPLLDAVQQGASLVIAGQTGTLLELLHYAQAPDEPQIFEDWSSGAYANWIIEGDCLGTAPATGKISWQQDISGPRGKHFVNTFAGTDDATGRATSRPFTINKRYIHLAVGGGNYPGQTCVNLRVGKQIIVSATGENTEHLRRVCWNVAAYQGQEAVLEIVDARTGGWGHILVGDILFSDSPFIAFGSKELLRRCQELLPFAEPSPARFDGPVRIKGGASIVEGLALETITAKPSWRFDAQALKPGTKVLLEADDGMPLVLQTQYGNGRVIVCNGDPGAWFEAVARKTVLGRLLAAASDADYAPFTGWSSASPLYGSMAVAVLHDSAKERKASVSSCPQWTDFSSLWRDFSADGCLRPAPDAEGPSLPGATWNTALSKAISLRPREEKTITFVLAWHFPNRTRDDHYWWGQPPLKIDYRLGNRYNAWFGNAGEVAQYVVQNAERLERQTRLFHDTFYDSTLPRWLLDGITANMALVRSPIYVWLEDGTFAGFEGADNCCPMNCTHVYNYVMSAAHMFPELERNVRETDLLVQMHPERHFIPHRTVLPLSLPRMGDEIGGPFHHALDGELGTILKTYREWRLHGEPAWLATLWGNLKKVMQHVMSEHDADGDGVIKGEQPNTYDTHAYGSNTFIGTLYLAALRAAEEMARVMNDPDFAGQCRIRFEQGRTGYDRRCWNGEYYYNVYDMPGAAPDTYNQGSCWGPGCFSDQLLGQWWAHALGLGHVLPPERVRQAIHAVYRYNWRPDLSKHAHNQRVFAEGREKGLLVCTWPTGNRPARPIAYCDEVWTGIEYHVAATLIWEGFVEEGLQIAKGARDRYTGEQRNPWAEIECGHHYSRAMSVHSLLPAAAGYEYDAGARHLAFAPNITPGEFKAFFTSAQGWGALSQRRTEKEQRTSIAIECGVLTLKTMRLSLPKGLGEAQFRVRCGGRRVSPAVRRDDDHVTMTFAKALDVREGKSLEVRVVWA